MCVCGAHIPHIPVTGLSHRSRSRPLVESWMRLIWSKQSRRNSIVLVIMRDPNKSARLDGPKGCKGGGGRGSALLPMDQKTEHHFSHQSVIRKCHRWCSKYINGCSPLQTPDRHRNRPIMTPGQSRHSSCTAVWITTASLQRTMCLGVPHCTHLRPLMDTQYDRHCILDLHYRGMITQCRC